MTPAVFRCIVTFLLVALLAPSAMGTHLRAVEIQVTQMRCDQLTVEIAITAYINYFGTGVRFGEGILDLGDGTTVNVPDTEHEIVDADLYIGKAQFKITHTYATVGRYKVSYVEGNRNIGILNFNGSGNTPFYSETSVLLAEGTCNSSPILLVPPLDRACSGIAFYHNPGAFDADEDSLSYELLIPKRAANVDVTEYLFPNQEPFYSSAGINYDEGNENKNGRPLFQIDPYTGVVTWDAPGSPGEYGFAIRIKEWRYNPASQKWYEVGYVVRDMQVIVEECSNGKPIMDVPLNVCVSAGDTLQLNIPASDPDKHDVVIEAFSELFSSADGQITTDPPVGTQQSTTPPQAASFRITWNTTCEDVQSQSHRIVLKISDRPPEGPRLIRFYTINIKVIAPGPEYEQVTINPVTKKVTLEWKDYFCENVTAFQVLRRISEFEYDQPECETGLPPSLRYQLMAEVPATELSYTDDELSVGSQYCYRIIPLIGDEKVPGHVSVDTCFIPKPAEAPVIVNVSVENTDELTGSNVVRWTKPFDIDADQYPAPYRYKVFRKIDSDPQSEFTSITPEPLADTVFADIGINTLNNAYRYRIELYVPALTTAPVDTSSEASSAFANAEGLVDGINIQWKANTPWSNYSQRHPHHLIYRGVSPEGPFELIDSVNVNQFYFNYTDVGQYRNQGLTGEPYYYKVKTRGTYGNPKISAPRENFTQVTSAQILDTIPPCVVKPSVRATDCSEFACDGSNYYTRLEWASDCSDEVMGYEIFVKGENDESYNLLATVKEDFFVHSNLSSLNKCYRVLSVDYAGNRSDSSAVLCNSNCINFKLPNVITPRIRDDRNDYLTTYPNDDDNRQDCARSVQSVELKIFSRWGDEIYTTTLDGESLVFWDGRDINGKEVSDGVYFYQANVLFDTTDPALQNQQMKGWVQVIR